VKRLNITAASGTILSIHCPAGGSDMLLPPVQNNIGRENSIPVLLGEWRIALNLTLLENSLARE
jgi:hypothetical protein